MIVYRCSLTRWAKDLSGLGSFLFGGRWNNPGTYMVYSAENNVLAALEVALRIPLEDITKDYVMIPIEIPDDEHIAQPSLPKNWYLDMEATRSIGEEFISKEKYMIMKVTSALISDSYNYLINPRHRNIKDIKVMEAKPILFDSRLMNLIQSKVTKK